MSERGRRALLWAATAVILIGCVAALWLTGFFEAASSLEGIKAYIQRCAPWSHLAFFGIQLVSVILAPIPSNITAAGGAILFGLWPAFALTYLAVAGGSMLVFALSRALGQGFAEKLVSRKLSERYLGVIRRKRDVFLAMAFLFPFFPDDLLCILAGLPDIPFRHFAVLCLLTRPWGLLVACAVGSSAVSVPLWGMALLGAAGLGVFLLAMRYGDAIEEKLLKRFGK